MNIQFKKGLLELCILSMLDKGNRYGYDIANELSGAIKISDGSVYPVLRRLKQDEFVSSYLEESSGGPPRKYYVITDKGKEQLHILKDDWLTLEQSVDNLIKGEEQTNEQI